MRYKLFYEFAPAFDSHKYSIVCETDVLFEVSDNDPYFYDNVEDMKNSYMTRRRIEIGCTLDIPRKIIVLTAKYVHKKAKVNIMPCCFLKYKRGAECIEVEENEFWKWVTENTAEEFVLCNIINGFATPVS